MLAISQAEAGSWIVADYDNLLINKLIDKFCFILLQYLYPVL